MKTIQCTHPAHHHNGFVATWWLWTASGRVNALLVLELTGCSTSIRQGAFLIFCSVHYQNAAILLFIPYKDSSFLYSVFLFSW